MIRLAFAMGVFAGIAIVLAWRFAAEVIHALYGLWEFGSTLDNEHAAWLKTNAEARDWQTGTGGKR